MKTKLYEITVMAFFVFAGSISGAEIARRPGDVLPVRGDRRIDEMAVEGLSVPEYGSEIPYKIGDPEKTSICQESSDGKEFVLHLKRMSAGQVASDIKFTIHDGIPLGDWVSQTLTPPKFSLAGFSQRTTLHSFNGYSGSCSIISDRFSVPDYRHYEIWGVISCPKADGHYDLKLQFRCDLKPSGGGSMKSIIFLTMFTSVDAFALGPIPNGTYQGTETCDFGSFPNQLIFTDNTLTMGKQVNGFEFDSNSNGFFKVKSISGMNGGGLGHFTDNGLHYEIIFDYVDDDGSTHPAPGEDTFTYKDGVVHLDSSASSGPDGKVTCTGDFTIAP